MSTINFISLDEAIKLTSTFRSHKEAILCDPFKDRNILPVCESFDRECFDKVLAQDGCTGLRIYLGMDNDYLVKVIVVGVNANQEDILPAIAMSTLLPEDGEPGIIENGNRCPYICPPPSSLNI